jgi:hypothetical protein
LYALQGLFGFALGQGFESIRLKYANTHLSDEARYACEANTGIIDRVSNYDAYYSHTFWFDTKPPGLAVFYLVFKDIMAKLEPDSTAKVRTCFDAISRVSAYLIPLLASLVILLILGLNKLFGPSQMGYGAALIYMLAPNVVLMSLVPDQFLFPLLFVLAIIILAYAITKKSFGFGVLSGAVIYLAIFFSFSLLPLIGFVITWIVIDYFIEKGERHISASLRVVLGICLGIAVVWIITRFTLNYDPIARYINAFQNHQEIKGFQWSLSNLIQYALLNNVEFAFWSGLPLFVLMIAGWIRSIVATIKGKATRLDAFFLAFLAVFLALNIVGQTRGEVGRLWIFLLPVGAMVASNEATRLFKNPSRGVPTIMALQFITTVLAFIYLDFR